MIMSVISFRTKKEEKEKVKAKRDGLNVFQEALHIIDELGAERVHDKLGQQYMKAFMGYKGINKNRFTIALVLGLSEDEYKEYVERMFELSYSLEMFDATYSQADRSDGIAVAVCLTILPRIIELLDWFDKVYDIIETRWDSQPEDLNLEVASLFIQSCDMFGLDKEEINIDYENLLNASRSADRYVIVDLNGLKMRYKTFKDKGQALMYIMQHSHLKRDNLIERY